MANTKRSVLHKKHIQSRSCAAALSESWLCIDPVSSPCAGPQRLKGAGHMTGPANETFNIQLMYYYRRNAGSKRNSPVHLGHSILVINAYKS